MEGRQFLIYLKYEMCLVLHSSRGKEDEHRPENKELDITTKLRTTKRTQHPLSKITQSHVLNSQGMRNFLIYKQLLTMK